MDILPWRDTQRKLCHGRTQRGHTMDRNKGHIFAGRHRGYIAIHRHREFIMPWTDTEMTYHGWTQAEYHAMDKYRDGIPWMDIQNIMPWTNTERTLCHRPTQRNDCHYSTDRHRNTIMQYVDRHRHDYMLCVCRGGAVITSWIYTQREHNLHR